MDKDYITRLIYEYNPQWKGEFRGEKFKRDLYYELKDYINKKQIVAVTGIRRVGKTTILKQILNELPAKECLFFSFDEEETRTKECLVYVIDYFLNNFRGKYIFLDEVHYVLDWQGVLKRYYDANGIKFIISGSASIELKKARESLAGRIMDFYLPPLSFNEYLRMLSEKRDNVEYIESEIGNSGIEITNMIEKFEKLEQLYYEISTEKEYFEEKFKEYIYRGAFPEIAHEENEKFVREYVKDIVVKKILFSDLPGIFEIKRQDLLYDLFKYIAKESGNLFEIKNLCNIFNADYETVSNYLHYLESSFLIKISQTYSKSFSTRLRKAKKVYVSHPSLAFGILDYSTETLNIEQVVGNYVEGIFAGKFFWRSKSKKEVDAVFETDKNPIPIEIKYRRYVKDIKSGGMVEFMKKFKVGQGLIGTKDVFKLEEIFIDNEKCKLLYLPVWFLLLITCGKLHARQS